MPLTMIENQLRALDYGWFSKKKEWFKEEAFYNNSVNKIYETLTDTIYFDDIGIEEDVETVIDVDLQQYCWSNHYPNSLSGIDEVVAQLPVDSGDVSEAIINNVSTLVSQAPDTESQHRIIMSVVGTAAEQVELFKKADNDEEYHKVLDDFLLRLRQRLGSKFRAIKDIYLLSKEYPERERLEFNLNQEELGV